MSVTDTYLAIKSKFSEYRSSSEAEKVKAKDEAKLTVLLEDVLMLRTTVESKAAAANIIISASKEKDRRSAKVATAEFEPSLEAFKNKVKQYHSVLVSADRRNVKRFL